MANSNFAVGKILELLERTKDALIADLQKEFVSVDTAIEAYKKEETPSNLVPIVNAVFAKVGYDISHYEEMNDVREVVLQVIKVTEDIGKLAENFGDQMDAAKVADLMTEVIPCVKELIELVKSVSDIEWKKFAEDVDKSALDIRNTIKEEVFTEEFVRKVLDHILITLMKNARVVFKDEVEFVKFTVNSGIEKLEDFAKTITQNVRDQLQGAEDQIKDVLKETFADVESIKDELGNKINDFKKPEIQELVDVANALSKAYAILEFLGVIEEKELTLQLPAGIKDMLSAVSDDVEKAAEKISNGVDAASDLVAEKTGAIVDGMNSAMSVTRDITGTGVAAAGTLGLQLDFMEKLVGDVTDDFSNGLASIAAVASKEEIDKANKYSQQAKSAAESVKRNLTAVANISYPVKVNIISWERIAGLMTNPVDHFKSLYHIDSMADVECLMTKIMDILHSINPDIPDFSQLKNLLEDLLRRLQQHVIKILNDLGNDPKVKEIWDWLQSIVRTIREIIQMLENLGNELKGKIKEVVDDVKSGVKDIANDLSSDFTAIKNELKTLTEGVSVAASKELSKNKDFEGKIDKIESTAKEFEQKSNEYAAADTSGKPKENASDPAISYDSIKIKMPKMPSLSLPTVIRNSVADPLVKAIRKTLDETLDFDFSCIIALNEERLQLQGCIEAINKDVKVLEVKYINALNDIDLNPIKEFLNVLDNNFSNVWTGIPDISAIVEEEVVPDLKAWAYGVVRGVETLVAPSVWEKRLDTVVDQLRAEFQNDLGNITGLISKEGALQLVNDASSVKGNLLKTLSITDYIRIIETAVNDVVLPDPEYYYTSFKQTLLGILSRLSARIISEVRELEEDSFAGIENIKTNFSELVEKLKKPGQDIAASAENLIDDIVNAIGTIRNIVENRIPETVEACKSFVEKIQSTFDNLKTNVEEALKKIAKSYLDNLEDYAREIWKTVKNEYILPIIRTIKNRIIYYIKHVVKKYVEESVKDLVDTKILEITRDISTVADNAEKIRDSVETLATSAGTFLQSDMNPKDIIAFVQALYRSVPDTVKDYFSDVLPSLPSLPDNQFTDLLKNVSCNYDLDNLMCNVTLFNLKEESKNGKVSASTKLQLFIMVGQYSKEGFVEKQEESTDSNKEDGQQTEEEDTVPAIFFTVMLDGRVAATFGLGDNHELETKCEGEIGSDKMEKDVSVGFCLSKKDDEKGITSTLHGFGSTKSLKGLLTASFRRKEGKSLKIIQSKYLDINIGNYPITGYVLYNAYPNNDVQEMLGKERVNGFSAGVYAAIEDMELVMKLGANEFLGRFVKDDISAKFTLKLLYDYLAGFKMDGGYSFHIDIDCNNRQIGPLNLSRLGVDIGSLKGDFGTLQLAMGSDFGLKLGDAVTLSFENLKLGMSLNLIRRDHQGHLALGDFDFDFKFRFPEGIGVAINCDVVNGGAIVSYDDEKGELFGALELTVLDKIGVSAMLMMDLGTAPGHFFSMLAMLSARFSPGIPMGMGFSLTAIGGMLGLQRMLDYDAICEAVHNGTLESVFFVENVVDHIAEMKKSAESIFPAKEEQFFLGLLGQISYEPVVKCSFGLMLQLPDPCSVIIVGVLNVGIKGTDVIRINVAFSGEIDFSKGLQFNASLYDSSIVGIRLEGDMAFRLFWGGRKKGFLMSVGGFHPAYTPEESMHVGDMRRLAMKLDYGLLKVGLETYLAITSNTFQIGAHLDIKVGWDKFGIVGYAGFDALFQFDPFLFIFDIEAGMAVMVGGKKLLSVSLSLSLSGPRPWHAKGKAKFRILFLPISVHFDLEWGSKKQSLPSKTISVLEQLNAALDDCNNWSVDESSRRDKEVPFFEQTSADGEKQGVVLVPSGVLSFSQNVVPMEEEMQLCNDAKPTDYVKVTIDKVKFNNNEKQIINTDEEGKDDIENDAVGIVLKGDFAPALYHQMENADKLKSPSYVQYVNGFTLNNNSDRTMGKGENYSFDYEQYKGTFRNEPADNSELGSINKSVSQEVSSGVAYQLKDKTSVSRYMEVLDSIQ